MKTQSQYAAEREAQTARMREIRGSGRDIEVPEPVNWRRRRRCLANPAMFCTTYFPEIFYNPFTADQRELIDELVQRMRTGGSQAKAAARGDGKTSIVKAVILYGQMAGLVHFPVVLGPNADHAEAIIADIAAALEQNDNLDGDFPELCHPFRALEGSSARGRMQTVDGRRTHLRLGPRMIRFPTVHRPASVARGQILVARGVDSAIRGINYGGRRPDFVLIDDPETRESAKSPTQTANIIDTIEQDAAGLGGQDRAVPMVLLCTIQSTRSVAATFTDRVRKPAWNGSRQKMLKAPPSNPDLWEKYIELRHAGQLAGDNTGRAAAAFYADNRDAMDAGAVVSNPYRFDTTALADGSTVEISALQHAYNLIADIGLDAFNAEYQNDPPAEDGPMADAITTAAIQRRTTATPHGIVPSWARHVTTGIDVGGRFLTFTTCAWGPGFTGTVIDYGTQLVDSPRDGRLTDAENVPALEAAIESALHALRDALEATGYPQADTGEIITPDLVLVDSGWRDQPVYAFTRAAGRRYQPAKGFGTAKGQTKYRPPGTKRTSRKRTGNHWHATKQQNARVWLHNVDADYWKRHVHTALAADVQAPGALTVYGPDPMAHRAFAEQITAEVWTREWITGKGFREFWDVRRRQNHYLDATAYAAAAAAILGLTTVGAGMGTGTRNPEPGAAKEETPPPAATAAKPPAPRAASNRQRQRQRQKLSDLQGNRR